MGYKKPQKLYKLTFQDHEGLVVKVRSATLGEIVSFMDLAGLSRAEVSTQADRLNELFALFAKKLYEWNLEEEDGTPVPKTLEALLDLDSDFALEMVMAWLERVVSVSDPLDKPSNGGDVPRQETSLLYSGMIPMTGIPD